MKITCENSSSDFGRGNSREIVNRYNKFRKWKPVLYVGILLVALLLVKLFDVDMSDAGTESVIESVAESIYSTEPSEAAVTENPVTDIPETPVADITEMPAADMTEVPAAENPETPVTDAVVTYRFRSSKLLNQHYEKHGIEMGFADAASYEAAASKVITNPNALHKTEAEDGDGVYYVEATNEFVILSTDGYIRTYFLPSGGIDYYNRQ